MMIKIFSNAGAFAENKDVARDIRVRQLLPALQRGKEVILDFKDVQAATQSFIHALISDAIRQLGSTVFDRMKFKNCNESIRQIITIVGDYMQAGLDDVQETSD